jgi:Zn-dependent oligopeptidase
MSELAPFLDELNETYLALHRAKEEAFWETRMGLAERHAELVEAETALRRFLGDADRLKELRKRRDGSEVTAEQRVVMDGWILTLERNQVEDEEAREIQARVAGMETELQRKRTTTELGWRAPDGSFTRASSVELANLLRTHADEGVRKGAFEGLRSIEAFALRNGYAEIVKLRNRFARRLGHDDYYDYKVRWAEGFDKPTLFRYLDDLEARTRDRAAAEIDRLRKEKGDAAIEPWNFVYHTWGGEMAAQRDPYFRFEDALERWVRSFAALGIRFRNARVTLDLVDRKGKYENGFMHGTVPPFVRRGEWLPAEINFTANALPSRPGAGVRAAQTLFHEGGHAAHFSNIVMGAPCFSQEFAPTSAALAETQSMFCDSFLGDADWQTRYARDESGNPLPFELLEREVRTTQPFAAQAVRNMLVVCYAEKELYELPDDELTDERILAVFRDVEQRLTLLPGGCPRPTLAVPHLLSWEASAYYHGYVLAQMAVHQTRVALRRKHGHLLDNPAVGRSLADGYWRPGNSRSFLDLVREATGEEFSADALVKHVSRDADRAVAEAREAIAALEHIPEFRGPVELDLRLRIVHGSELVVEEGTPPLEAAERFRAWLTERWPREEAEVPAAT